eukprot:scaffold17501_cov120-Skeletonema_menzelii.AAC.2
MDWAGAGCWVGGGLIKYIGGCRPLRKDTSSDLARLSPIVPPLFAAHFEAIVSEGVMVFHPCWKLRLLDRRQLSLPILLFHLMCVSCCVCSVRSASKLKRTIIMLLRTAKLFVHSKEVFLQCKLSPTDLEHMPNERLKELIPCDYMDAKNNYTHGLRVIREFMSLSGTFQRFLRQVHGIGDDPVVAHAILLKLLPTHLELL